MLLPPARGPLPFWCQILLNCGAGCLYHIQPPWAHQAGPINNLGPCLPSAPKAEAQARLSSSGKPSMTTFDGSNVSVLHKPAREGRGRRAKGWNWDCLPRPGWAGLLDTCHLPAASPFRPGPLAWMRKQCRDARSCRVYTQSRGPGAGVDRHFREVGQCLAGSPALPVLWQVPSSAPQPPVCEMSSTRGGLCSIDGLWGP